MNPFTTNRTGKRPNDFAYPVDTRILDSYPILSVNVIIVVYF
jgi:hypothetical protein